MTNEGSIQERDPQNPVRRRWIYRDPFYDEFAAVVGGAGTEARLVFVLFAVLLVTLGVFVFVFGGNEHLITAALDPSQPAGIDGSPVAR